MVDHQLHSPIFSPSTLGSVVGVRMLLSIWLLSPETGFMEPERLRWSMVRLGMVRGSVGMPEWKDSDALSLKRKVWREYYFCLCNWGSWALRIFALPHLSAKNIPLCKRNEFSANKRYCLILWILSLMRRLLLKIEEIKNRNSLTKWMSINRMSTADWR